MDWKTSIIDLFIPPDVRRRLDPEEGYRRQLYVLQILLGVAILTAMALLHFRRGDVVEGLVDIVGAGFGTVCLVKVRNLDQGLPYYRANIIFYGLMIIYYGTVIENDFRIGWVYSFPLIALFMVGLKEGLVYTAIVFTAWMVMFQMPADVVGAGGYGAGVRMRFVVSFGLVLAWTCVFEYLRSQYQTAVTERQENLEKKTEEVARANRAMSEFLTNMSHEMRTPLNAIVGFTRLSLSDELPETSRENLRRVETSSEDLLGLINDILDLSKIEAGKLSIEAVPFDLREAVSHAVSAAGPVASEKGLQLRAEVADGVPGSLVGDPLRLGQVLRNLISNAVKFTERGEVVVRASAEPLQGITVRLTCSVTDTGIGIEREFLSKLFDTFSQADASTSRRYGGTGLGLSICHQLVELMGGQTRVESEPGRGSTFSFQLDLLRGDPVERPAVADRAPVDLSRLRGARVLVAEDIEANYEVLRKLLEREGMEVSRAHNGAEALEAVGETSFDIVLMDLQMPEMDGYTAAREIRTTTRGARLPIIAVSAHAMPGERDKSLAAGMDDHVAKPIAPVALYQSMARLIDAAAPSSAEVTRETAPAKTSLPLAVHVAAMKVQDRETLIRTLRDLADLTKGRNAKAAESAEDLRRLLGPAATSEIVQQLCKELDTYDFDAALQTLDQFRQEVLSRQA